jgi:hypothetical protein
VVPKEATRLVSAMPRIEPKTVIYTLAQWRMVCAQNVLAASGATHSVPGPGIDFLRGYHCGSECGRVHQRFVAQL